MAQRDAAPRIGMHEARTEEAVRGERTYLNGAPVSAQDEVDVQIPRTAHSHRCEQAYRDWTTTPPSQRPLAVARGEIARAFDAFLHERWLAGDAALSNVAVARACGVDERMVRGWREGEKALPAAALLVMPVAAAQALVARVQERRILSPHRRGAAILRDALEQLEQPVSAEDRGAVLRELLDALRRINEQIAKLATEGR